MIRAVVDTNVLVSGLLSPNGNEALVLLAIRQGFLHPCLSEDIFAEYAGVLARPKFGFPPDEIVALLAMLREKGDMVSPLPSSVASPDPAASKFIECAITGGAEFIVTGNKRHFPDAPYGIARVVNAAELFDRITVEP